jgi:hypothetical protein
MVQKLTCHSKNKDCISFSLLFHIATHGCLSLYSSVIFLTMETFYFLVSLLLLIHNYMSLLPYRLRIMLYIFSFLHFHFHTFCRDYYFSSSLPFKARVPSYYHTLVRTFLVLHGVNTYLIYYFISVFLIL